MFFFFNDTATTEIYTLSLHDALPISRGHRIRAGDDRPLRHRRDPGLGRGRSEEHTSELQSQSNLVCRLLLEKKIKKHPASLRLIRITSNPSHTSHTFRGSSRSRTRSR